MIDRFKFVEGLGKDKVPKHWKCKKHNVMVSPNCSCPMCEYELLKEKRIKEIEEINRVYEETNSRCHLKLSVRNKPNYWKTEKERRRKAQIKSNKKKGEEYWKKVSKENWQRVKVRKLERRSMFGNII